MKVSELGEVGLIDLLAQKVAAARNNNSPSWRNLIIGMGDDAAAWKADGAIQLATVDSLVQGVHFSPGMMPWSELGWKALAVNLSDIAAMGGTPRYALVSLALPGETEADDILALYGGMLALAQQHGVAVVGGDTDRTTFTAVSVVVMGSAEDKERLLRRSSARAGDMIAVTGYLGAAAAGLKIWQERIKLPAPVTEELSRAFWHPIPRVAEGHLLVKHGVRAAIDISDGLVADLTHLCRASRVSAVVQADSVPVHPAVRDNFGDSTLGLALGGGEDYELLFTAPEKVVAAVREAADCPVTVIGEIGEGRAGDVNLVDRDGILISLSGKGWEHFKSA